MASGRRLSVALFATPFAVAPIVTVRGVGIATLFTVNLVVSPDNVTDAGHTSAASAQSIAAVSGTGGAAVNVTVTVSGISETELVRDSDTLAIVGGFTVSVAVRVCPSDVAEIVTVREVGT